MVYVKIANYPSLYSRYFLLYCLLLVYTHLIIESLRCQVEHDYEDEFSQHYSRTSACDHLS